jgi:hypothetical protein
MLSQRSIPNVLSTMSTQARPPSQVKALLHMRNQEKSRTRAKFVKHFLQNIKEWFFYYN